MATLIERVRASRAAGRAIARASLAALACVPGAACGADGLAQGVGRAGAELAVGTARDATLVGFRALADEPGVWLVPGEQGLQHVVLALAAGRGFDAASARVHVQLRRAIDGEPLGETVFRRPFGTDPADPARLALPAFRVVVVDARDPTEYCSVLDGGAIDVVVDLDDAAGPAVHLEARTRVLGLDPQVSSTVRDAWSAACARTTAASP